MPNLSGIKGSGVVFFCLATSNSNYTKLWTMVLLYDNVIIVLASRGGGGVKEWSIFVSIASCTSETSISFFFACSEYTFASSNTFVMYPVKSVHYIRKLYSY